jgi:transcriptional regulator with XRE-family HTH domain
MKQSAISRIESNKGLPGVDRFEPLAKALGVPVSYFFEKSSVGISRPEYAAESRTTRPDSPERSTVDINKVIDAYRKLEPGSPRKLAVDVLLFAGPEGREDSDSDKEK